MNVSMDRHFFLCLLGSVRTMTEGLGCVKEDKKLFPCRPPQTLWLLPSFH